MSLTIIDLNEDVLFNIFDRCSLNDMLNLYHVCSKFQNILKGQLLGKKTRYLLIVGHHNENAIAYQRTHQNLSYHRRLKLYTNWTQGRYEEHKFFRHRYFHPAQIHLEHKYLYITVRGEICAHRRLCKGIINRRPDLIISSGNSADITCFVKKKNMLFLGQLNGCVQIRSIDNVDNMVEAKVEDEQYNSVHCLDGDFERNIFLTITRTTTKAWRIDQELGISFLEKLAVIDSGNKCLRLSPDVRYCASGKYSDTNRRALHLIDIETLSKRILSSRVRSVYDILWRDNNIIFTGNYDTTFRMFDLRTNADEAIWADPYDLSVYCLSYDGNYGVLCGLQYHGRVNLYDIRMPEKCVQMYFPKIKDHMHNSPVYSVASDQCEMFIVTDQNLRVFDFNADWAPTKDYTSSYVPEYMFNKYSFQS